MTKRKIPRIFVVMVIIATILSGYLIISTILGAGTKNLTLRSDNEVDAGYINLKRNNKTPSALDFATFENKNTYTYFSLTNFEVKKEKVFLKSSSIEGKKYIDYEIVYLSGKKEEGTLTFK